MSTDTHLATVISATGLSVGYGPREVVSDISFELDEGSTLVLMGPGGSGKTTLLRALEQPQDIAKPWVRGHLELAPGPRLVCRQKPEFSSLTLRQLLGGVAETPTGEGAPSAEAILETAWSCAPGALGFLKPRLDLPLETADRDVLALAALGRLAAAAHDLPGAVLLLDEPTAEVSAPVTVLLTELLSHLGSRHTMILVTHDQRLARHLADKVMLLAAGRHIETAPKADFFERPREPRTRHFVRMGS